MFFRRKKSPSESTEAVAGGEAARAGDGGATAPAAGGVTGPASTQFLTGEAGRDRKTVQVLLEAIARVSEARDLESLLMDIVDI